MQKTHVVYPRTALPDNPKCPKCGWPMWLSRIEPDHPGHDRRSYECPACDYEATIVTKLRDRA